MKKDPYLGHIRGGIDFTQGRTPPLGDTFPCIGCQKPLRRSSSSSICSACMDPEHFGFVRGRWSE